MPPVQLSEDQRAAGRLSGWVTCPLCGSHVPLAQGRFFFRIAGHADGRVLLVPPEHYDSTSAATSYATRETTCRASGSDVVL